jgi:polyisoprenoid-binding protein YceI
MKKLLLTSFVFTLALACSTEPSANNEQEATEPVAEEPSIVKTAFDTSSKVQWLRYKHVKNSNNTVKIGKTSFNLQMNDLAYTTEGTLAIKEGWWQDKQGKFESGTVKFDMTSISSLQLNESREPELKSPDYLDAAKYPVSILTIEKIENGMASGKLTIKDTTASVQFPAEAEWMNKQYPKRFKGRLVVDGKAWKLYSPKVSQEIVSDSLVFNFEFRAK